MIYTPRSVVSMIERNCRTRGPGVGNAQVNTKIEFYGYEISIAMDSSLGAGDLTRADIRVYHDDQDVSERFHAPECNMIYGTAGELFRVMNAINDLEKNREE